MNKEKYLKELSRLIRKLPDDEREKILEFYREIIEDKIESGETEERAVGELGDARFLAQKILSENPNRKPANTGKVIGVTVLSVFGVLIVAGITVSILGYHAMANDQTKIVTNDTETLPNDLLGSEDYVEKTYTAEAEGVGSVVLDAENKAVKVIPSDTDKITISYVEGPNDTYTFSDENGVLSMKSRLDDGSVFWNFRRSDDETVKITVTVPSSYKGDFSIVTTNSYIGIGDFKSVGTLKCKTQNSAIQLDGLSANAVSCETQNGAITLTNVSAEESLSAQTQNAIITLDGVSSPDISLETQNAIISGTVSGSREDYTVDASTTNAVSNLQSGGSGSKKLKVRTTNAIISISFQ